MTTSAEGAVSAVGLPHEQKIEVKRTGYFLGGREFWAEYFGVNVLFLDILRN